MYKRIFFFNTNFNSNKQVSMLVTIESENFFFEKKKHWNNPSIILKLKLVLNNLNNLIYTYK